METMLELYFHIDVYTIRASITIKWRIVDRKFV